MASPEEVNRGTVPPNRKLRLLEEEERRLEAQLLKVKEGKALEQQWRSLVAAQGELEQQALNAFRDVNVEDEGDDLEQEGLECGNEGFESEDFEYEAEESEEPPDDTGLKAPGAGRSVENLWQELGLAGSDAGKQGMQFLCKDGVCVPACLTLLAAASPDLVALIAHHLEEAYSSLQEVTALEVPLPDVSSSGLLYLLHCLQTEDLENCQDVYCELSVELCFELLSATSLFEVKEQLDTLVLASSFKKDADESTLVGYLNSARRLHPAKPQIRDRVVEYLQKRLQDRVRLRNGLEGCLFKLCWDDFKKIRLLFFSELTGTTSPAMMMSAWSMVIKESQYVCPSGSYWLLRDILIWAAWQVSGEAAREMKLHLPNVADYLTAYCESGTKASEDDGLEKSSRQMQIKAFREPLPNTLPEVSKPGVLKAVLEKCGWNWPWGILETIHPEILLFKVKPLGIIDECRLKKALRWQVLQKTKPLSIKRARGRVEPQFSLYIYKVLQQVHPGKTMSLDAIAQVSCFLQAVLEKLSQEAARFARANKQSTISWRNVEMALKLLLSQRLGLYAVNEARRVCRKYYGL